MVNYIFGRLQASDDAMKSMKKAFRSQERFNHSVTTFALVMTAYAIAVKIHNSEQNKKIEEISKELKRMKGE